MPIAVIGSTMVDLFAYTNVVPKAGETRQANDFQIGCGGKGANQAVAAAKLGSEVLMIARVGDDAFADTTLTNFESHGVTTELVEQVAGVPSGVASIWVDKNSQNRILINAGANNHLLPADIDRQAAQLAGCSIIVLQLEIPLETVYHAIDFGNAHNIPVILNPAPANAKLDLAYACRSDFFVPNETELEILTGMPVSSQQETLSAAAVLLNKGLKNIIVTLGDKGAVWLRGDQQTQVTAPTVKAIDTTGAGDAFIGCFAHYYATSGDVLEAINHAVVYASHSVTSKGTQPSYADRDEFAALL